MYHPRAKIYVYVPQTLAAGAYLAFDADVDSIQQCVSAKPSRETIDLLVTEMDPGVWTRIRV